MHRFTHEAKKLIKLSLPILIASIAQTGMSFVDTVMAGGASPTDLAAVAIASGIWLPTILFGVGILMALIPTIAQMNGAQRHSEIPFQAQQGIYTAAIITIPILIVFLQVRYVLELMDIDPLMFSKTEGYIFAVMPAAFAMMIYQSLRSFIEGMSLTKPAMYVSFIGLFANIPLNWIFVYGHFGAPKLGAVGCGVATSIVIWLMTISLIIYVFLSKKLRHVHLFSTFYPPSLQSQIRLFRLGLPIAASIFFEVSLFSVVAIIIAPLGATIVASHQIALNFSSLVFMFPLSLGLAVSIRVGHQLGEQKVQDAKISSYISLVLGVGVALITAIATVVFREQIARLYTEEQEVIVLATQLLLLAAVYQLADTIQVIASGVLRGYKDMSAIFVCTFTAYWLVGLPSGYILGKTDWFVAPMGATGFWYGFIIGLTTAAIMLGCRLWWIQKLDESRQLLFSQR